MHRILVKVHALFPYGIPPQWAYVIKIKTQFDHSNKLQQWQLKKSTHLDLESNEAAKCKFFPLDLPKLPERRRLSGVLFLSGDAIQKKTPNTLMRKAFYFTCM